MELQSACTSFQTYPLPPTRSSFHHPVQRHHRNPTNLVKRLPKLQFQLRSVLPALRSGVVTNSSKRFGFRVNASKGSEPFGGKAGSVSFGGLSHQSIEESKSVSAPFKENTGSLLWVLAPVALISSLVVPQFVLVDAIEDYFKNELFAEIIYSFSTEVIFYGGLAMFLFITEHVQKPYLQFSSKRWSLITGLRGYITSAYFTMGFKVFAPIIAVYVTWPILGIHSLVSAAPFLIGCLAQYLFERRLDSKGSSCWPLLPIIFEVYRIYQLMRASRFIERLMYAMKDASMSPAVSDRFGALVSMVVTYRILGVVCLWSLLTFLMRLFPSRPVAENY